MVLLMLDIDHFKNVNDTYGHNIGDEALRQITAICSSELRSFDIFGRVGGEEFSILLIKTDAVIGHQIAERLRRSVENHILTTDKGLVKLTISIGGVAFSKNEHSLDYRLNQSDEALYSAKSTGRNRTVLVDTLTEVDPQEETLHTGFVSLKWNKTYECGNKQIDEQHRNLFNRSNRLLTAMIDRQETAICQQYIEELICDVSDHFKTEEEIIDRVSYPKVEEHRQIHKTLTETALNMAKRHKDGQLEIAEVFHYLAIQVVSQHMLIEDRNFFSYF